MLQEPFVETIGHHESSGIRIATAWRIRRVGIEFIASPVRVASGLKEEHLAQSPGPRRTDMAMET
jgi:hypothetical protein